MTFKTVAPALVTLALITAACGEATGDTPGEDSGGQQIAQVSQKETATPTPTPTPPPDKDGDGTEDSLDYAPSNAKIQTEADAKDCEVLGIDHQGLKEGPCTLENGTKVKVVNRSTRLTLPQVGVQLNSITAATTIPRPYDSPLVGHFVVANLSVTNRLDAPVEIDGSDQFALGLGKKTFTADFDAMNTGQDDGLVYETLQPDETRSGAVVFRVSAKAARHVETDGNFLVYQFTDADNIGFESPKRRVGLIRTYH
jgi:hypothetical protein